MSMLLAGLFVVGWLAVPFLYADDSGGEDYREPPAVENEAVIVAENIGGDDYTEPSPEEIHKLPWCRLERVSSLMIL
jgi:hypothetical protein